MASGEPFTKQYQAALAALEVAAGLGLTAPELDAGETVSYRYVDTIRYGIV